MQVSLAHALTAIDTCITSNPYNQLMPLFLVHVKIINFSKHLTNYFFLTKD